MFRFRTTSIHRDFSLLLLSVSISYGLAILAMPLITRLFTPEEMGTYLSIVAICAVLNSFANLRFDLAIPVARSPHAAAGLAVLSVIACAIIGLPISGGFYLGMSHSWWGFEQYPFWAPLVVYFLLQANNVFPTFQAYLVRSKSFKALSVVTVSAMFIRVSIQILTGVLGAGALGLIAGELVRPSSMFVRTGAAWSELVTGVKRLTSRRLVSLFRRYSDFPKFLTISTTLNALGLAVLPAVVYSLYDAQTAGLFGLALRLADIPVAVIGKSLGDAYVGNVAQEIRTKTGAAGKIFRATTVLLIGIAVLSYSVFLFFGQAVVEYLFGAGWGGASAYFPTLAVLGVFYLPHNVLERSWVLIGRQKTKVVVDLITAFAVALSFVIGAIWDYPFDATLMLLVAFRAIIISVHWPYLYFSIRHF